MTINWDWLPPDTALNSICDGSVDRWAVSRLLPSSTGSWDSQSHHSRGRSQSRTSEPSEPEPEMGSGDWSQASLALWPGQQPSPGASVIILSQNDPDDIQDRMEAGQSNSVWWLSGDRAEAEQTPVRWGSWQEMSGGWLVSEARGGHSGQLGWCGLTYLCTRHTSASGQTPTAARS